MQAAVLLLALSAAAAVPEPVPVQAATPAPAASYAPNVTPELLARWSVPLDAYMAMTPERKAQLRDDLAAGERVRTRRVELIRRLRPQEWAGFVDAKGFLTPDGARIVEDYETKLKAAGLAVPVGVTIERADGKEMTAEDFTRARAVLDGVFDGTARLGEGARPRPATSSSSTRACATKRCAR
ncbi:MAG: hypothetical protein M0D55_02730 [Elusimicrobiota bacterium]|nr:MAG: hypothetical protein M0D55_02730 [Elusimicrobiota bacterium]